VIVVFKCKDCESEMRLNFERFASKAINNGYGRLRCQACGNQFPDTVGYELHTFISSFNRQQPNWEIAFTLSEEKRTEN